MGSSSVSLASRLKRAITSAPSTSAKPSATTSSFHTSARVLAGDKCIVDASEPAGVLESIGGGVDVDLLKTHPKLLLGSVVIDNPCTRSSDGFLVTRQ
jgi:hypothetical protein